MWHRTDSRRCPVLRRVRHGARAYSADGRVQAGDGVVRRRRALDGHRRRRSVPERLREIMAELVNRSSAVVSAVRRNGRQVHRRRNHGSLRSTGRAGGPRRAGMPGGVGNSGRGRPAGRGSRPTRRHRAATAGGAQLRTGDRRGSRFAPVGLHRGRRAGGVGAADGVRCPAGRSDAQRVHRPIGGTRSDHGGIGIGAHQGAAMPRCPRVCC